MKPSKTSELYIENETFSENGENDHISATETNGKYDNCSIRFPLFKSCYLKQLLFKDHSGKEWRENSSFLETTLWKQFSFAVSAI